MRQPPTIHGRLSDGSTATTAHPAERAATSSPQLSATTATPRTALLPGRTAAPRPQHSAAARACHASYHFAGDATYHILDFIRVFFVLQSLTSRWLYQLFLELDEYGWAPDKEIQKEYLGYPIASVALAFAIVFKVANAAQQKWLAGRNIPLPDIEASDSEGEDEDSTFVRETKYLAAEDYGFAVFSSSMLYMILDAISQTGRMGKLPVGWFITTTALVPITAFILAKTAMPDTKNIIMGGNKFPTYPDASRTEKLLDAGSGAVYGSSLLVIFWTINRELANKTVPLEIWQGGVAAGAVILSAISGYHMVNHPKAFHGVVTLSKGIRDASLAYAALSGLAYQVLTQIATCPHFPCWGADEAPPLTTAFTMISAFIGIFSAATSLYRYDEKHQANLENIQTIRSAPGKIAALCQRFGTFARSKSYCDGSDDNHIGLPTLSDSEDEVTPSNSSNENSTASDASSSESGSDGVPLP